jgi:acetylornithine deacetylase/succinyl-diaminopimelate desuccinylase-like protein
MWTWACRRSSRVSITIAAVVAVVLTVALSRTVFGQGTGQQDPVPNSDELLQHFQALLRLNTSNPPGNERLVTDYLKQVLEDEGIPVQILALDPARPNLVARLKGNGTKRPILLMGHTDVVTVDEKKWTHPPFGAVRSDGYIYGRGALDDKPSVAVALMTMLTLKRSRLPLERDVIFLAEAGEEGTTRVGIDYIVNEHFSEIDAEFCLAEGGGVRREAGVIKFASVGVLEKIPRTIELVARGPSAHGSVPRSSNAVTHLAAAVLAISGWEAPVRLNETTREYFTRLATLSSPGAATQLRGLLSTDRRTQAAAIAYFQDRNPAYVAMLRTSASPTIIQGGMRYNVVPSEATATIDVRLLPDEDPSRVLATVRQLVNDPAVEVRFADRDGAPRPPGGTRLDTDAFRVIESAVRKHYQTTVLPTMSTGASDKAQVRSKGVNCYGIGPATDAEDAGKGFGGHSDQERILESELQRFGRFYQDVVTEIVSAK